MNLTDCYCMLGLRDGASTTDVKASYRRLARKYHPDVNPGDPLAQGKFIQLTEAYKLLLQDLQPSGHDRPPTPSPVPEPPQPNPTVERKPPSVQCIPPLSPLEQQMKWNSYQHLQALLKEQRFARAIALVEGLAQRIPQDPEVRQWQAITYQCWGRHWVKEKQWQKARIYLKKALRTDPHNRSLWAEIERDFRRMEQRV